MFVDSTVTTVVPEPSSRVTEPGVMLPTCTVIVFSRTLNPGASTRTMYSAGLNGPELDSPAGVTTGDILAPVALLVITPLAFPTLAPFGSRTEPWHVPF